MSTVNQSKKSTKKRSNLIPIALGLVAVLLSTVTVSSVATAKNISDAKKRNCRNSSR